jgi:hypothetical protein
MRIFSHLLSDRTGSLVVTIGIITRRTVPQRSLAASRTASVSDRDGSFVGAKGPEHPNSTSRSLTLAALLAAENCHCERREL